MELVLPNDVLLLIGEQLEHKADRCNLIFVSRHFHDLFLPLVYRKASFYNWQDANSFLHAILQRPALARAVRELDLTGWHAKSVSDDDCDKIQGSESLHAWLHAVSCSRLEIDQWSQDLGKGLADAWVALVFPLLSQLRKLSLAYTTNSPHLERIMQQAVDCKPPFSIQPAFRHLHEVSLYHREDLNHNEHVDNVGRETQLSSALLLPFFQLPSVRTIIANSVVDRSSTTPPSDEPTDDEKPRLGFSSITDIDLRASSGNHGMEMLVSSCADLKSFKYQHSDSHVLSHGYQPSAFHRSLSHSKKSLQTLWLDNYGSHYPFTAAGLNQNHDEWFGSLVDFTALQEVRVRLPNLLDIRYQNEPTTPLMECLPSSLETLYIEGCEEQYLGMLVSQLQTVIKSRKTRFPQLKRVHIEGAFHNAPSDDDGQVARPGSDVLEAVIKEKIYQAAEPLHIDCANAGLELHLHDRALSHI
ncbi:uncharacterized protein N7479_004882 [Penicillium vulpinum]|uniref:Leucine-rich repeat domain-containing protein n=1 Tax=Penicillium vulpinum TaxID=29845 RepID=A0A1V6REQ8_9EURO|nr:uncharacterized protein N7479_004882 [Penicillium vulpinum]KAJ5965006.1 hypothetical protein N7479_004882 [Penicillium vulpinum]OQD99712.1 hypothetical protein PENVUL_c062G01126 [Penicillium vulpinum]